MELTVRLKEPHEAQQPFIRSGAKRRVVRAGRRFGKTVGAGILAVERFLDGGRVLYATPTQEQIEKFWFECKLALAEPIDRGVYYKNETRHIIEVPGTEQRIRAKTAWNADTLRGDYAGLLILDEYQLMKPDAWGLVGAPMLLDTDGDAVFIYTGKRGKNHAKELYKRAEEDTSGRWAVFQGSSQDNPHISEAALDEIAGDMTQLAYRLEILAEDIDDDPRALWTREALDRTRLTQHPGLARVVVGVDPPGTAGGAECGIVVAGISRQQNQTHGYVLADYSLRGKPHEWGAEVVAAYHKHDADRIVAEVNFGGDMVESTIRAVTGGAQVAYKAVRASRGKAIRAEPVAALYEKDRVHHVGQFGELEDEYCTWVAEEDDFSPNRLDAAVWAITDLMLRTKDYPKPGTVKYA